MAQGNLLVEWKEVSTTEDSAIRFDAGLSLRQDWGAKAQLVKLRFFAGLTVAQAVQALGVSSLTAESDRTYTRSWLKLEMSGGAKGEPDQKIS